MSDWTGVATTLAINNSLSMAQTNAGTMIFAYQNLSPGNDDGFLNLASGGARPEVLEQLGGSNIYNTICRNWNGNNLQVTNTSKVLAASFTVVAMGPGRGDTPVDLPMTGTPVTLAGMGKTAQGIAPPQWLTLRITANSSKQTIFGLIGGGTSAAGINGYSFGLNFPSEVPPPADGAPPANGYYQQTTSNSIDFQFNFGPASARLWIVNYSSSAAASATVAVIGA